MKCPLWERQLAGCGKFWLVLNTRIYSGGHINFTLVNKSTSYKYVNVESNNLLGYAGCWIQQLVAPGVLQVVGSNNLGA